MYWFYTIWCVFFLCTTFLLEILLQSKNDKWRKLWKIFSSWCIGGSFFDFPRGFQDNWEIPEINIDFRYKSRYQTKIVKISELRVPIIWRLLWISLLDLYKIFKNDVYYKLYSMLKKNKFSVMSYFYFSKPNAIVKIMKI